MKKLFLLLFFFVMSTKVVLAAGLEQATIRLSRMETGVSPLPVLVTIKTNSNVAENGFKLILGNAWQINSGVVVSTSALASGVNPWPLLAVAQVNGNEIIFDSGDLTADTLYGFYITQGLGLNPSLGDGAAYIWELATLVNGQVDSSQLVKVTVVAGDAVTITGKVRPNEFDYEINIVTDSLGIVNQNQEIGYTITYSSKSHLVTYPLLITATWGRGSIDSQPGLAVDVADYKLGSATNAYGGAAPVIDLVNRTITWTITSMPAQTENQTVSFGLITNAAFTGSQTVNFLVTAQLLAANMLTISGNVITEQYRYFSAITPTSIPSLTPTPITTTTPGPVVTSATTPSPTPSPTSTLAKLIIDDVNINQLIEDSINFDIYFSRQPKNITIKWGIVMTELNSTVKIVDVAQIANVTLNGLSGGKKYYFRITAEDVVSDIFTFTTPVNTELMNAYKRMELLVVAKDVVLVESEIEQGKSLPTVIIPTNLPYMAKINLPSAVLIKRATLSLKNKKVLGMVSNEMVATNTMISDLFEVGEGKYVANLLSPEDKAVFEVILKIYDFKGAIIEKKVGELRVVDGLIVVDSKGLGIERAKVSFERLNLKTNLYEIIPANKVQSNPVYSESNGKVALILPMGSYRILVEAIGFRSLQRDFIIGNQEVELYPRVVLTSEKAGLLTLTKFYSTTFLDTYNYIISSISELGHSYRFFNLLSLLVVLALVFVTGLSFSYKIRMPWYLVCLYLVYKIQKRFLKKSVVEGVVVNEKGFPITGAKIYLIDSEKNIIINKTSTNIFGRFYLPLSKREVRYKLSVISRGYDPSPLLDYSWQALAVGGLVINLGSLSPSTPVLNEVKNEIGRWLGFMFEGLLIISLVIELAIGSIVGWWKMLPLIGLSLINYSLWLKLAHEK